VPADLSSQPSTLNHQPSTRKWPHRLLWFAAFCFLLSAFFFVFRTPLLRSAANLWIVDDPVPHADAIVILGGGLEYRPFAAAQIYSNLVHRSSAISASQHDTVSAFLSPIILISQPELSPTAQLGLTTPESVLARQVLLKLGIPESAIQMLGTNVTSTHDEALALKQWAQNHNTHSVVIPTDIFHTRRVRWTFQRALRDVRMPTSGLRPLTSDRVQVHVMAIDPPRYGRTNWWYVEEGLIAFQNEVLKSLYYHLR
jgi:uncharacterized SAM-binding protein YcdF (DUF218 family)